MVTIPVIIFLSERQQLITNVVFSKESVDYWQMFAAISKEKKYFEELDAYYRIPAFTPELMALSGKELTLTGYYLPYSKMDSVIIISRYPNASCFFCGQAGVESVAMVELHKRKPKSLRTDQLLRVKGKLFLNSSNVNKLAFVLEEAMIE